MPSPVASPFAVPTGGFNPPGNGLARWISGVLPASAVASGVVVEVAPSGVYGLLIPIGGAQKMPQPPRTMVLSFTLYARPNRGEILLLVWLPVLFGYPFLPPNSTNPFPASPLLPPSHLMP